jgi:hypothetical protein
LSGNLDSSGSIWNGVVASGVVRYDFLLTSDPFISSTYTASYVSGVVTQESWYNAVNTFEIKRTTYSYVSGIVDSEIVRVYDEANGVSVAAQTTTTYTYTSGSLTSASKVRNV